MSILKVDTLQPATGARVLSAGHVVQVVQGSTNTAMTSASTSYADTGLTATITPTSTSSKVLVRISQHYRFDRYGFSIKIMRGSTNVHAPVNTYQVYSSDLNTNLRGYLNYEVLDAPSSTSALTYKTQVILNTSSGTGLQIQGNDFFSFMTLMEIAQ
tara:strand:- start:41 stop:511 length:471 start_codon:yes stop_codon:yes gene_type:complete